MSKATLRKFARLIYERTKDSVWKVKGYSVESPCIQVGPDDVNLVLHYRGGLLYDGFCLAVILRVNASASTPGGSYVIRNPWGWEKKLFWAIQKVHDQGSINVIPTRVDDLLSSHSAAAKQAVVARRVLIENLESSIPPPGALSVPTETQGGQLTLEDEAP